MFKAERDHPIGVFDSGLGGLTVVKALRRMLPHEHIVYFGDTARVPYGTKSKEAIIRFSKENVRFLLQHNVKMVVVACNSSSSYALNALKKSFRLPITGVIEAGVKRAVSSTRNKVIGIVATQATIASGAYQRKIKALKSTVKVIGQACPLFVPLAEEGWFRNKATQMIAREYLTIIRRSKADTVILGCTHYPLLKPVFRRILGRRVTLIDSAQEVALEVREFLTKIDKDRLTKTRGRTEFYVSDMPSHFSRTAARFLGYQIRNVKRIS